MHDRAPYERRDHRVVARAIRHLRERGFLEQDDVGALADLQGAEPVGKAEHQSRVRGGGGEGLERCRP